MNFDVNKKVKKLKEIIFFLKNISNKYNLKEVYDSDEESDDEFLCPICFENIPEIHLSPCRHMFCMNCIQKFRNNICPICRINLKGVLEFPQFQFKMTSTKFNFF